MNQGQDKPEILFGKAHYHLFHHFDAFQPPQKHLEFVLFYHLVINNITKQ